MDAVEAVRARKRAVLPHSRRLTRRHFEEIARASEEFWEALLRVADQQRWTPSLTGLAVSNLSDNRLPAEHKEKLLVGEIVPVLVDADGDFTIPPELLNRALKEWRESDPRILIETAVDKLSLLRLRVKRDDLDAVVRAGEQDWLADLEQTLPAHIAFLTDLLRKVYGELHGGRDERGRGDA